MPIYSTYLRNDLKTLKAQGQRICEAWKERLVLDVTVKFIRRLRGGTDYQSQEGFVVVASIFDTYLCHYVFHNGRLTITPESEINPTDSSTMDCQRNMLQAVPSTNALWRERVALFKTSQATLFRAPTLNPMLIALKFPIPSPQFDTPLKVLSYQGSVDDWFAVDASGRLTPISIARCTVYAHGGHEVDVASLPGVDPAELDGEVESIAGIFIKVVNGRTQVLGRSLTPGERTQRSMAEITPFAGYLDRLDRPFWM